MFRALALSWLAADAGKTVAELTSSFAGWDIIYLEEKGVPAAAAFMRGTEIHFVAAPEWRRRLIRRDNVRTFLAPLLERAGGMLTTRVLHGAAGPDQFVRRMQFVWTWADENFNYFALTRVPFQRSPA